MRIFSALFMTLRWRVAIARSGLALRVARLITLLLTAGGIGMAIGYAIVGRGRIVDDDNPDAASEDAPS